MSFQTNENNETIGSLISGKLPSSSEAMDAKRATSTLRDFLLKLDQAREWICTVTHSKMDIAAFKEELPKAEILARVVQAFEPSFVKRVHVGEKREFRHTDNIMLFLNWCRKMKLRRHFLFETVDLYEEKNIPNVIFCIHGLALFLSRRGLGRGIVVNKDVVFTYEENSLFANELEKISMQKYEDIDNRLDDDSGDNRLEDYRQEDDSEGSPVSATDADGTIRLFNRTVAWAWALGALRRNCPSVSALRKFIDFDLSGESAHQAIAELQNEIVAHFKLNSAKEIERDSVLHTIRLLHENMNRLRSIHSPDSPLVGDGLLIKQTVYRLVHDYRLCYDIVAAGFELPFRMLFPDNQVGDFHFSKFVAANMNRDDSRLLALARAHFISSRVFRLISEAYASSLPFDMNPIAIHDKASLLDDAMESKDVRDEIVRRAQFIIDFINAKFDFLLNIDFPYYIRLFSAHPRFFEYFIEPAIFSSGNNVIAELMGFIYATDKHERDKEDVCGASQDMRGTQERLYKEDNGFIRTTGIGFSDYAPLKGYLDDCMSSFPSALMQRICIKEDVNEYFLEHPVEDLLQVETSMDEINSLVRVLKGAAGLMSGEMLELVSQLEMSGNRGDRTVEVQSNLEAARVPAEVWVNGSVVHPGKAGHSSRGAVHPSEDEASAKAAGHGSHAIHRSGSATPVNLASHERFKLSLDNQFSSELDEEFNLALNAMLKDIKYRTMLLITLSGGKTLDCVLKGPVTGPVPKGLDVESLKLSVASDLSLLRKRGVFGRDGGAELLRMIANDILACKYRLLSREVTLNVETSDALFHKGAVLDRYLHNLYAYLNDMTRGMFRNKSGVLFNRQAQPVSRYGTYLLPLEDFRAQAYEGLDIREMYLKLACDDPLVFRMTVLLGEVSLCEPLEVRI